jgi:hypothetical protein
MMESDEANADQPLQQGCLEGKIFLEIGRATSSFSESYFKEQLRVLRNGLDCNEAVSDAKELALACRKLGVIEARMDLAQYPPPPLLRHKQIVPLLDSFEEIEGVKRELFQLSHKVMQLYNQAFGEHANLLKAQALCLTTEVAHDLAHVDSLLQWIELSNGLRKLKGRVDIIGTLMQPRQLVSFSFEDYFFFSKKLDGCIDKASWLFDRNRHVPWQTEVEAVESQASNLKLRVDLKKKRAEWSFGGFVGTRPPLSAEECKHLTDELRELYKESGSQEVEKICERLQGKFYGSSGEMTLPDIGTHSRLCVEVFRLKIQYLKNCEQKAHLLPLLKDLEIVKGMYRFHSQVHAVDARSIFSLEEFKRRKQSAVGVGVEDLTSRQKQVLIDALVANAERNGVSLDGAEAF